MKVIRMAAMTVSLMILTGAHALTISVTNTNDNGAGSLRAALASTADDDTINFTVSVPALQKRCVVITTTLAEPNSGSQ